MVPADAFKACALFRDFTPTGLQIFSEVADKRLFSRGGALFNEGDKADGLFIVMDGTVSLSSKNAAGIPVSLCNLGKADSLGELALLQPTLRMCSAIATTDVSAVELKRAQFQELLGKKPQACVKLLMNIVSLFGAKVQDNREALKSLLPKKSP